jgi:hypothetical protein
MRAMSLDEKVAEKNADGSEIANLKLTIENTNKIVFSLSKQLEELKEMVL